MRRHCAILLRGLEKAGEGATAVRMLDGFCRQNPDDFCASLVDEAIAAGVQAEGMALLHAQCDLGSATACMRLGMRLGHRSRADARAAMKRACALDPAICHRVLLDERAFASHDEILADAIDACVADPSHCAAIVRMFRIDLRDEEGARHVTRIACESMRDGTRLPECGTEPQPSGIGPRARSR